MKADFFKDRRFRLILISSFVWGILAHGMAMFNKFSYHDDAAWFNGVGETYGLGRWALGLSGKLTEAFSMSRNYSTPVFNGLLTIAAIAFMVALLCDMLSINDSFLIVSLCGVMVCFPAVTNIFGYVFTAPYYYIGALLGIFGAYLYYRKKSAVNLILCTLLMAFSTGLYQSNIAINLMVLLLFMLNEVVSDRMKWKDYIVLTVRNALICACFMAEYFVFNMIALAVTGVSMYEYKGVSSFGVTGPVGYILRAITAYKRFIRPVDIINYNGASANMFPWNLKYFHMLLVLVVFILAAILILSLPDMTVRLQAALLIAVSPLFAYFIYVMVAEEDAHGGMTFGESFMFVLAAFIIERVRKSAVEEGKSVLAAKVKKILIPASAAIMLIMGILFARFANVCYLKAQLMQTEAINYYNDLITQIRQTPGYTTETPVVYVGERNKDDGQFSGSKLFDPIYLPPYQGNSIINDFAWEETMNMWCAFSRQDVPFETLSGNIDEIKAMPNYPDNGSVKMVNGVVVVKFAD